MPGRAAAPCPEDLRNRPLGPTLTRRATLLGLAGAITLGRASLALADAPTERRFVVVLLRGALDGLSAVVPYGDPGLATLRAALLPPQPGGARDPKTGDALLDLGGFYGLHPSLAGLHGLYRAGQLLPVHAVAGNWRMRSHFEAQDCMESGADHRMDSGWLNRVAGRLPPSGPSPMGEAVAFSPGLPLLLRGAARVGTWLPEMALHPDPALYRAIADMSHGDRLLGPAIAEGLRERGFTDIAMADGPKPRGFGFATLASAAGRLLATRDGPRLAALELTGWDTHVRQSPSLAGPLATLDHGLMALKAELGDAWADTAVLVMTEFGRTARVNGTGGTDHGTGTIAFLLGGRVAGGRVRANWPGLKPASLFENRDLAPTTDLRALAKGVLASHLGLDTAALGKVFPNSAAAPALTGLIKA
jgi:uncharacterized protein (DUF1501 family)